MFVLVLFLGWAVYTLIGQEGQLSERRTELQESVKKLNDVTAQTEAVKAEIARLNDPEYIGQIARKEQGMGLPGETPIQIEKTAP
jgi:cell division protein DivIC